ncbi:hydrogenase nickel incorporation protein HypA/HybF [Chitinophaga jiangningensis]|uniref:Hydrogenase nickel incorporation protein HypA/HybF n=1 Tax=Chitinophaga jiangningensis TaxID=1419482 RepID=A0A1M7IVI8_9BACT|nr:hydrogenase maturation nickel metallochaperone HypA [Chitinophaga jiangningensis]SHM44673.1 hydrogenase nickel incorporation protein HypA/HybF [Chitinophaga jiangningensis]
MHEVPIVRDIVNTLQEQHPDKFDRITKVQVQAGLLCNVQPILIQNAFEALIRDEPQLAHIDLEVVLLPIIAYCESCEQQFEVIRHKFVCGCGTPSRKIVQGEELRISKVEFLT